MNSTSLLGRRWSGRQASDAQGNTRLYDQALRVRHPAASGVSLGASPALPRRAKASRSEGTNEVQRMVTAKHLGL